MRVEAIPAGHSAERASRQDRAGRRRQAAELCRARRGVRPARRRRSPQRGHRARRSRRRLHGQLLGGGGRDLRRAQGRRACSARSIPRPRPTSSPSSSTIAAPPRVITQPRLGSVAAEAVAEAPSVKLVVLAGGAQRPGCASCLSFEDALASIGAAPPPTPRHRHRPRHADLHLGLDRLPQGRDDDAPEHRRRRDLDHHLSREHARTTSSSTCCRSPSTTASTRC